MRWALGPGRTPKEPFVVDLDTRGKVLAFHPPRSVLPPVDREALRAASPGVALQAVPDSALRRSVMFVNEPAFRQSRLGAPSFRSLEGAAGGVPGPAAGDIMLGPAEAISIARFHIEKTAYARLNLVADSTWIEQRGGVATAGVRFHSDEELHGQRPTATVHLASTGALLDLESNLVPDMETLHSGTTISLDHTRDGIEVVIYILLLAVFLFALVRRFQARAVDGRTALRDALLGSFLMAVGTIAATGSEIVFSTPSRAVGLLLAALTVVIATAAGGFLVFCVSAVSEASTREHWSEKIEALTLMRLGFFRNVPVGMAVLRGLAVSGILLGVMTLLMMLSPAGSLQLAGAGGLLTRAKPGFGAAFYIGEYGYSALIHLLLLFMGVGALLYRKKPAAWLVVPGIVLMGMLMQLGPFGFTGTGYYLVASASFTAVLAVAFWRYESVVVLVGYFFAGVFWSFVPIWSSQGHPLSFNFLILAGLLLSAVVVGVVGLMSGRDRRQLPEYVPSYVRQHAIEERLKGELEIARMVQGSFLPGPCRASQASTWQPRVCPLMRSAATTTILSSWTRTGSRWSSAT